MPASELHDDSPTTVERWMPPEDELRRLDVEERWDPDRIGPTTASHGKPSMTGCAPWVSGGRSPRGQGGPGPPPRNTWLRCTSGCGAWIGLPHTRA
jgi:hypothetical protein